jgi:hypothetical protein
MTIPPSARADIGPAAIRQSLAQLCLGDSTELAPLRRYGTVTSAAAPIRCAASSDIRGELGGLATRGLAELESSDSWASSGGFSGDRISLPHSRVRFGRCLWGHSPP